MPFWITLEDGKQGCLNSPRAEEHSELLQDPTKPVSYGPNPNYLDPKKVMEWVVSRCRELTGKFPTEVKTLPYGSGPALDPKDDKGGWFCFQPNTCKGSGSCPRSYACSE